MDCCAMMPLCLLFTFHQTASLQEGRTSTFASLCWCTVCSYKCLLIEHITESTGLCEGWQVSLNDLVSICRHKMKWIKYYTNTSITLGFDDFSLNSLFCLCCYSAASSSLSPGSQLHSKVWCPVAVEMQWHATDSNCKPRKLISSCKVILTSKYKFLKGSRLMWKVFQPQIPGWNNFLYISINIREDKIMVLLFSRHNVPPAQENTLWQ